MCQIITGPSATLKSMLLNTSGLLEALHDRNPDGWGAMYHSSSGVKVFKKLPTSAAGTRKWVSKLPDDNRFVACHWRMRTSGRIDQHNAHPHAVEGGWLIHNGVLDVDTKSNPDFCDTHHFARQYLDGAVDAVVSSPRLQAMIGEFIQNNRFVLMSDSGQHCTINADQGYEAQGCWFANTYSMPRGLVDPRYVVPQRASAATWSGWPSGFGGSRGHHFDQSMWYDDGDTVPLKRYPLDRLPPSMYAPTRADVVDAVLDYDVDSLAELLLADARTTARYVLEEFALTQADAMGAVWCDLHASEFECESRAEARELAEALFYGCEIEEVAYANA